VTRLGVVLPSVNTVVEKWFNAAVPADVSLHAARMYLSDSLHAVSLKQMEEEGASLALRQLSSCRPDAVAYCCTASSIIAGPGHDVLVLAQIQQICGVPGATATTAMLDALSVLNCRRVVAVSPYATDLDRAEREFFRAAGLEVLGGGGMGISDAFSLATPEPSAIARFARSHWRADAEALVISCLNLCSHAVIEELEGEFQRPVVTATQAVLWRLLRLAERRDTVVCGGRLFREH
jgi:maleate isomerase